jgi:predicted metal-dependent hydrolase
MTRAAYFDSFGHKRHSERFWDLLEWPDYEAAKQGIR